MTQPITQSELESYLWGAAVLLRGFIDAGDYKQFIFPLMFFKRLCDVYDEERERALDEVGDDFPEYHRFQILDCAHWRDVRMVRFPGWQNTSNGERQVKMALRRTLAKYQLHKDNDLFARAYKYIAEYY